MTLPSLLTPSFWFAPTPPALLPWSERIILAVLVAFIVAGVIAAVVRMRPGFDKLVRRGMGKAAGLLITTGLAGLLLYAFVYEGVPYLSMRALWIAWLIWVAIWTWMVVNYFRNDIPAVRAGRAERERLEKWLPKKKK